MPAEKINFRQQRDFTELFNVSVKFIRQNFSHLFRCILFIAGPFLLLTAVSSGLYQQSVMTPDPDNYAYGGNPFASALNQIFSPLYFVYAALLWISSLVLMGAVFEYMLLYQEKGPRNFTPNDVGKALVRDAGNILWTFGCLFFWSLVFIALIVLIYVGFSKISYILLVVMGFFGIIGLMIIIFPLFYYMTSIYLVRIKERQGFLDSAARAFWLMKSNYWWTWLIFFCVTLIQYFLSLMFSYPEIVMNIVLQIFAVQGGISENSSVAYLVVASLSGFLANLVYMIGMVFTGFHVFSLQEKKEGTGLLERIDEIGIKQEQSFEGTY